MGSQRAERNQEKLQRAGAWELGAEGEGGFYQVRVMTRKGHPVHETFVFFCFLKIFLPFFHF